MQPPGTPILHPIHCCLPLCDVRQIKDCKIILRRCSPGTVSECLRKLEVMGHPHARS